MADDYNFGGSNPFGSPSPIPTPASTWNTSPASEPEEPEPEPVDEPVNDDVEEPIDDNTASSDDEHKDNTDTEAKPRRHRKRNNTAGKSGSNGITRENVERILALNDVLEAADERTFGLVKALAGLHYAASKANTIVALIDPNIRNAAVRALNDERDIISKLDDPFAIAITFASLTRDERKEHWNRVLACEKDVAAEISGNESGAFSQSWKDAAKESTVLNQLYTRTKNDYVQRLNDAEAVLTSI